MVSTNPISFRVSALVCLGVTVFSAVLFCLASGVWPRFIGVRGDNLALSLMAASICATFVGMVMGVMALTDRDAER